MDKAISAMIIEKMDSSAALYSELVIVNPMIPSGCLELFAVVAIIEFTTCFHKFSKYESTIFFTNIYQLKIKTILVHNHVKLLHVYKSRRGFSKGTVLCGGY